MENQFVEQENNFDNEMQNFPKDNNRYKLNKEDDILNDNEKSEKNINDGYPEAANQSSVHSSQKIREQEIISDKIYKGFIFKVYGILSIQLLITIIFIFLFQIDSINSYFTNSPILSFFLNILAMIGFFGFLVILSFNKELSRKVPFNYISLLIITICMALMCSFFALNYSFSSVLFCVVLTFISAAAITYYAYYSDTNWDNIKAMIHILIGQLFWFFLMIFFLDITLLEMISYLLVTLLIGIYLIYDTQVILKKYGEVYTVDDYIYASLQVYLDISNLFTMILSIIGKSRKK